MPSTTSYGWRLTTCTGSPLAPLLLALLMLRASAYCAGTRAVPVEGQHGAAYVSYGYVSGAAASLDNLAVRPRRGAARYGGVCGWPLHGPAAARTSGRPAPTGSAPSTSSAGICFHVGGDALAAAAIGNKTGGGVSRIPLPRRRDPTHRPPQLPEGRERPERDHRRHSALGSERRRGLMAVSAMTITVHLSPARVRVFCAWLSIFQWVPRLWPHIGRPMTERVLYPWLLRGVTVR